MQSPTSAPLVFGKVDTFSSGYFVVSVRDVQLTTKSHLNFDQVSSTSRHGLL
jgi:hypothetical protein